MNDSGFQTKTVVVARAGAGAGERVDTGGLGAIGDPLSACSCVGVSSCINSLCWEQDKVGAGSWEESGQAAAYRGDKGCWPGGGLVSWEAWPRPMQLQGWTKCSVALLCPCLHGICSKSLNRSSAICTALPPSTSCTGDLGAPPVSHSSWAVPHLSRVVHTCDDELLDFPSLFPVVGGFGLAFSCVV